MKRMMYILILLLGTLLSVSSVLGQDDDEGESAIAGSKLAFVQNMVTRQNFTPSAGNTIYQIFVDQIQNIGTYTATTGPEHPITLATGTRENILFGGTASTPGTSFNSIRSYSSQTDYVPISSANNDEAFDLVSFNVLQNPSMLEHITIEAIGDTGLRVIYELPGPPTTPDSMTIVQEINVVGTTIADTRIQVMVSITNTGNSPLSVGVRYLWDFLLQGDDSPNFVPLNPTLPMPTTEIAYTPPTFGTLRVNNGLGTGLFVNATVSEPRQFNPTFPDLLQLTSWAGAFGQAFDVLIDPTVNLGVTDNAAVYFFGDTEDSALNIAPGQTTTIQQSLYATSPTINTPPVAEDDSYNATGDQSTILDVRNNDFDLDGDVLTVADFTSPASGAIVQVTPDGQILYSPPPTFIGDDLFTYTLVDGRGGTDRATVEITVNPPNQPPTANNDNVTVPGNTTSTIDVLDNDTDPENDPIIVETVLTTARGARVVIDFPSYDILYTPPNGFIGEDTFLYTIVDPSGGRDTAQVTVTVTDPNTPPVANNDTAGTIEGQSVIVNVLANDSDPDGDALSVTNILNVTGGTAVINADNTVTFTPNAGFIGTINPAFTYIISDGDTGTAQAIVTINVRSSNRAPIAVDDTATTTVNMPVEINVLANDADEDGNPLTVSALTPPTSGTANVAPSGTVMYTPAPNFIGTATFDYTLSDNNGGTDVARVTVNVNSVVCAPGQASYNPALDLDHEESRLLPETGFTVGRIVNRSPVCSYAVGMASYFMFDEIIDNQLILDYTETVIAPGQTLDLTVTVPQCARQIDLFYGNVLLSLDGQRYAERLLEAVVLDVPAFCTQDNTSESP